MRKRRRLGHQGGRVYDGGRNLDADGLIELQMSVLPMLVRAFDKRAGKHAVLVHLPGLLAHVLARVYERGKELGIVPAERPGFFTRFFAMIFGLPGYAHDPREASALSTELAQGGKGAREHRSWASQRALASGDTLRCKTAPSAARTRERHVVRMSGC